MCDNNIPLTNNINPTLTTEIPKENTNKDVKQYNKYNKSTQPSYNRRGVSSSSFTQRPSYNNNSRNQHHYKQTPQPQLPPFNEETILKLQQLVQDHQLVLILIGIPGSGKTTFSTQVLSTSSSSSLLQTDTANTTTIISTTTSTTSATTATSSSSSTHSNASKWQAVNQDYYKSRQATYKAAESYIQQGYSVIIDRCNFDIQQRSHWIDLAYQYNCIPITLTLPYYNNIDVCLTRALSRGSDGLHSADDDWEFICNRMYEQLKIPNINQEKLSMHIHCYDDDDITQVIRTMTAVPVQDTGPEPEKIKGTSPEILSSPPTYRPR